MKRLPYYERAANPPPMQLTERDQELLETLYDFEGVLADYQIQRLFFGSQRRMQTRMSILWHNRYVDRFNRGEQAAFGFMAYFLDDKGIAHLAAQQGMHPKTLKARAKTERTSLIRHDVTLNDVRIAVLHALKAIPGARLVTWVNSRSFWRDCDQIAYTDEHGKHRKRFIRPDGYFYVTSPATPLPRHSRFLLEVDLRTESLNRVANEKIRPGLAYFASDAYERRFGRKGGRCLVVTTGTTRLGNMIHQAEKIEWAERFLFTTLADALTPGAFFTRPIWYRPGDIEPTALFMTPSLAG